MIVHVRWTYSMRASQCEICFDVTMQNVLHHNVNTFQEQTNFRESLKKHLLTQQNPFFFLLFSNHKIIQRSQIVNTCTLDEKISEFALDNINSHEISVPLVATVTLGFL